MFNLCDLCKGSWKGGIPEKAACRVVDGAACAPCVKLVDIEAQVANVEAILKRLTDTRRVLQTERNHVHNPPMKQVPPELISRIFLFYIPSDHDSDTSTSTTRQLPPSLVLGAVCKRWREIAWSTPALWTTLSISLDCEINDLEREREMTFQWLARSGSLPLSLYMDQEHWDFYEDEGSEATRSWTELLSSVMGNFGARCSVLDVQLPVSILYPVMADARVGFHLKRLIIHPIECANPCEIFSLSTDTPSPEHVSLFNISPDLVKISWSKVTYLVLKDCEGSDSFDILQHAPALVYYKFGDTFPDTFPHSRKQDSPQFTVHLQLRHLCIHPDNGSLLTKGIFPSLQVLSIWCGPFTTISTIQDFVSRSFCNLKSLVIDGLCRDQRGSLVDLLKGLPSLESLTLSNNFKPFSEEELFNVFLEPWDINDGACPVFLPNLKSLRYESRRLRLSWLLGLLSSVDVRPLSTISLSVRHISEELEAEENLRTILEFRRSNPAVTLKFSDLPSGFLQKSAMRLGLEYV